MRSDTAAPSQETGGGRPRADAGRQRFGRPSLTAALRELVRDNCYVTVKVWPRRDVQSREWWVLEWQYQSTDGAKPDSYRVEGQYLDTLLRRAAERLDELDAAWEAPAAADGGATTDGGRG